MQGGEKKHTSSCSYGRIRTDKSVSRPFRNFAHDALIAPARKRKWKRPCNVTSVSCMHAQSLNEKMRRKANCHSKICRFASPFSVLYFNAKTDRLIDKQNRHYLRGLKYHRLKVFPPSMSFPKMSWPKST